MDIGDLHNIHPANKLEVGARLAMVALAKAFHISAKHATYSGPVFKSADFSGNQVVIEYTQVGRRLLSRNGKPLNWFQLAGPDGKYVDAQARIVGKTVVVQSPEISSPTAVRFAWSDIAEPNLMNAAGLPALPFVARKP